MIPVVLMAGSYDRAGPNSSSESRKARMYAAKLVVEAFGPRDARPETMMMRPNSTSHFSWQHNAFFFFPAMFGAVS